MKVIQLRNLQREQFGGEFTVIENTRTVLEKRGHQTMTVVRSSLEIGNNLVRKVGAAINGVYSFSAVSEIKSLIARECPDVVHVHSVYPMWSPAIFLACRQLGIPTVMHVHNYYFSCPNWYHLRNGEYCDKCSGGKEYWCAVTNCRNSVAESVVYAGRAYLTRKLRLFSNNVGVFVVVSTFLKNKLIREGFSEDRIHVLPNVVVDEAAPLHDEGDDGAYVGFSGRLSRGKGVGTLLDAARRTGLPVRIAGDGSDRAELERNAPPNVKFLGYLDRAALNKFYRGCKFLVVPSIWDETFCMVAAEAMAHAKPVIGARVGAIPEIVEDGRTGLLSEPGNADELAGLMSTLWTDPERCLKYGQAARSSIQGKCNEDAYYSNLLAAYRRAAQFIGREGVAGRSLQPSENS
jgi:glycosyltransferase involved in cell wall biosynthesis